LIRKLIGLLTASLPLTIEEVTWNSPMLWIGGAGWNFNSVSSWRITSRRIVLCADADDSAPTIIQTLIGQKVVGVDVQSTSVEVDPVFILSDGRRLEIFATDTYEPWTMELPTGEMFVSSPGDEHAFD